MEKKNVMIWTKSKKMDVSTVDSSAITNVSYALKAYVNCANMVGNNTIINVDLFVEMVS